MPRKSEVVKKNPHREDNKPVAGPAADADAAPIAETPAAADAQISEQADKSEDEKTDDKTYTARMPYLGARDGINYEIVPSSHCHFALKGTHYGITQNRNLSFPNIIDSPTWSIHFFQNEDNIRGQLVIEGAIARDMAIEYNPRQEKVHHVSIAIDPLQVVNHTVEFPGEFVLPGAFGDVEGFRGENIALLRIHAKQALLCNSVPPQLASEKAQSRLLKMTSAFRKANKKATDKHPMAVEILVHCETKDVLEKMKVKFTNDLGDDPNARWSKDSPTLHALRQGNLYGATERPLLSDPSMLLNLRRVYGDRLTFLRDHVYCAYFERLYELGSIGEVMALDFPAVFIPIPGSAYAKNTTDNILPKMYRMTVKWPKTIVRPRKGERFSVMIPIEVPQCKVYEAPATEPNSWSGEAVNEINTTSVYVKTAEEEEEEDDDDRAHNTLDQNQTWQAMYLGVDALEIPGEITFTIHRPYDQNWKGPKDLKPTVGTVMPAAETRFKTLKRFADYVTTQAKRTNVKVFPIDHDQGWKDQLRCINEFSEMDTVRGFPNNCRAEYIRDFTLAGSTDSETLPYIFLDRIDVKKGRKILSDLNPYQNRQFRDAFSESKHGIVLVEGCPAAGKTRTVVKLVTVWLGREDSIYTKDGCPTHSVLWVTDTNEAVNQASVRIAESLGKMDRKAPFHIIRLYNMDAEMSMFINAHIANHAADMDFVKKVTADSAFIDSLLDDFGSKYKDLSKDNRRTDMVQEFTLHQAAQKYIRDFPKLDIVVNLQSLFSKQRINPLASTMKDIERQTKVIFHAVIKTTHVLLATCATALGKRCSDWFKPTLVIKDEDPKSQPQYTYGLIAAYSTLELLVLAGDLNQDRMYWKTNQNPEYVNPFINTGLYSTFERYKDLGVDVCALYQQHRMWNAPFVAFISRHFYNTAMRDGNIGKVEVPEVAFMKSFHDSKFGIPSNVIGIDLSAGRTIPEENGTSLFNAAHAEWVTKYAEDLIHEIKDTKIPIDKEKFTLAVLSWYTAHTNLVLHSFIETLPEKLRERFVALTVQSSQGTEFSITVVSIINHRWNNFCGEVRRQLVGATRWQYGAVFVFNSKATDYKGYKFVSEATFDKKEHTRHIWALRRYLSNANLLTKITYHLLSR